MPLGESAVGHFRVAGQNIDAQTNLVVGMAKQSRIPCNGGGGKGWNSVIAGGGSTLKLTIILLQFHV